MISQGVHSIALRDNTCCTARVCEYILNMLELLMDMGVMKQCLREESFGSKSGKSIFTKKVILTKNIFKHFFFFTILQIQFPLVVTSTTPPRVRSRSNTIKSPKTWTTPKTPPKSRRTTWSWVAWSGCSSTLAVHTAVAIAFAHRRWTFADPRPSRSWPSYIAPVKSNSRISSSWWSPHSRSPMSSTSFTPTLASALIQVWISILHDEMYIRIQQEWFKTFQAK